MGLAGPAEDPRIRFRGALEGYLASDDPRGRDLVELLAAGEPYKAIQVALSIARSGQAVLEETEGDGSTVCAAQAEWWRYAAAIAAPFDSIIALTACQAAHNLNPDDADGANQLGQAYHRLGNFGGAEIAYRCALQNAHGDSDREAVARAGLGSIALKRGDLAVAEDYYRRGLTLFKQLGRKRPQSGIFHDLGDIANTRGDFADAKGLFHCSLSLAAELGLEREQSAALHNLGNVSQSLGDLDEAEGYYRRSLEIDERTGMGHGQASGLCNLGIIALGRGDLDDAEELLERAVAMSDELGTNNQVANFKLGEIAKLRGDLQRAEAYFKECLASFELSNDISQGDALVALGTIAYEHRELDNAEQRFRRALSIFERFESKAGQAVALYHLADVAAARDNFDEAEEGFKRTLAVNEELGRKRGQANSLSKLGQLARIRGQLDLANDYHERAIALHEQIGSKTGMAAEHFNLGLVAQMRGNRTHQCLLWVESRDFYEQAGIQHEVEDVERRIRAAGCYGAVPTLRIPVAISGFVGTNGFQWWAQNDEHAFQMGEVDGMSGNPFNPPVQTGERYRKAYDGGFELGSEDRD
jgi:tetratricopeptide (TPR) repeat protein